MELGTEKSPSSDAPSLKIKTVSSEPQLEELPERSSDTTRSDTTQSEKGGYNQDGGESSQTLSLRRRRLQQSMGSLSSFFGTHFNLQGGASEIHLAAPTPNKMSRFRISKKAPLPRGTASTSSDSGTSEGISISDVSSSPAQSPTVIHEQGPLPVSQLPSSLSRIYPSIRRQSLPFRRSHGRIKRSFFQSVDLSDWPNTLPPADSSHSAALKTTLPPSSTDISEGGSVVQHGSRAGGKPEEQTICSEPELLACSYISSEEIQTAFDFGIATPRPSGHHNHAKSVPERGSTDLSSTQSGRYSGLHRPYSDPEGHGWRTAYMFHKDPGFDPLTPESTEIMCLQRSPASRKESNPSSAADAVPSTTLTELEFSSEEDLSFPSCLPNRNPTDDADSSSSTSSWTSSDTEFDWSTQFENASGAESDHQTETEMSAADFCHRPLCFLPASFPRSSDTHLRKSKRTSGCLTRCVSAPSLSEIPPPISPHSTVTKGKSLPNMLPRSSFVDFTPEITVELNEETFWLRCSCPGLYRCSVTGLVFRMTGDGVVVYRVVPWNRKLLAQYHKQPAGPLFDIKCEQQSVRQLYLPHCEIYSTDRCRFLSVAHVEDEGVELILPQKVTKTHIIINIARFSAFGVIKDEESPPEPVRALVLLFYRPPSSSDLSSLLNVLLLPKNVVLRDVVHTRKKLVGDESYIETSPHCKLRPKEEYTLSTCPIDDTVLVQPAEAEFDSDNYDNYFPSFQVNLETVIKHMKLFLKDSSQCSVWERRVCLSVSAVNQRRCPSNRNGLSHERLLDVWTSFINGVSGPVLKSLLDKLFEKMVITDSEREEAEGTQNRGDRARFVIDIVRKKGEAASSEMIKILCEDDPYLCEDLGLI